MGKLARIDQYHLSRRNFLRASAGAAASMLFNSPLGKLFAQDDKPTSSLDPLADQPVPLDLEPRRPHLRESVGCRTRRW